MSRVYQCSECQKYYQLSEEAIEYINNITLEKKLPLAKFICECACGIKVGFETMLETSDFLSTVYMLEGFDCKHENNNNLFKAEMLVKCDEDDPDKCSSVCGDGEIIYLKPKHVPKLIFSPLYDDFANTMKNLFQ